MRAGSAIYTHMARHPRGGRLPPPLRHERCAAPTAAPCMCGWGVCGPVCGCVWVCAFYMGIADIEHGKVAHKYVFMTSLSRGTFSRSPVIASNEPTKCPMMRCDMDCGRASVRSTWKFSKRSIPYDRTVEYIRTRGKGHLPREVTKAPLPNTFSQSASKTAR